MGVVHVQAAQSEATHSSRDTIYYHRFHPHLTHVGMVARRTGDPKLNEVAEAAIAYMRLTGAHKGFKVKDI